MPAAEVSIMRRIDALHLDYPFADSRMLRDLLSGEGIVIGRELVRTMMRRMCIEALYRRPNTSKPVPGQKICPYLLRGLAAVDFCMEAAEKALAKYGRPKIFDTDQGSQFTTTAFTGLLLENQIAISMDRRRSWRDNVLVERIWRSVKQRGGQ